MPPVDTSYLHHVAELEQRLQRDEALRKAVGGEFVAIGSLEHQLLRSLGLRDGQLVVDVGCGSGRLACQLAPFPQLRYFGSDVVPELLTYAQELCRRPDWRFECTDGTTIPLPDGGADFVCFFSVFTHLSYEDIFRYIREAHRVLKPGGLLVVSFLEFGLFGHWETFMASVDRVRDNAHLNQFFSADAIRAWAAHAGFQVKAIHPGDSRYIPLQQAVRFDDGRVVSGHWSLGQSLAVLQKSAPVADARVARGLRNLSGRGFVPPGGCLHAGFVVDGAEPVRLLVRAIGPSLTQFAVKNVLREPRLTIQAAGAPVIEARGPGDGPDMQAACADTGAFPLAAGARDAAVIVRLLPGTYSVTATADAQDDAGEVLIEVYVLG